jgi:hypothetical protein
MADEDHELPEGVTRPALSEFEQTRQLVNLTMMSEMVTALEEGKLSLVMAVKQLKEQLDQQKKDQTDVYYYLNKKCDDSYEIIATLQEQLLTEQADREVSEKQFEQQIENLTVSGETEQSKLKAVITNQTDKLSGLDTFMLQKETLEEELGALKHTLATERDQNTKILRQMDFEWTIERDKLRKGYEKSLVELREEMEGKLESRVAVKTRDIHVRNNEISVELAHQCKQADQVLIYYQGTVDKDRQLRVDLELAASAETEMVKKLAMYQRMVKELNDKMTAMEDRDKEQSRDLKKLETAREKLTAENNKLKSTLAQSAEYRAGKVITFVLRSHEAMITERLGVEELAEKQIAPDLKDMAQKHEKTLLHVALDIHSRFPGMFPCSSLTKTDPITFFPPLSPKVSGSNSSARGLTQGGGTPARSPRKTGGYIPVIHMSTQTDEHRDPISSETVWLTGSRPSDGGGLFQGGQWGAAGESMSANSSVNEPSLNHISVKSSSAIPHRPAGKGKSQKWASSMETSSLDGRRINKKDISSLLKGISKSKPLQITGAQKSLVSRQDMYERDHYSPASSVSLSPRYDEQSLNLSTQSPRDDATIDTFISPRTAQEIQEFNDDMMD